MKWKEKLRKVWQILPAERERAIPSARIVEATGLSRKDVYNVLYFLRRAGAVDRVESLAKKRRYYRVAGEEDDI